MGVQTQVRDDGIAVVTLDWPEQKNALGPDEATEVGRTVREAAAEPSVNALVLTGNGAFCAGGNVKGMAERAHMPAEERRRLVYSAYQGMIRSLIDTDIPLVAAVDGPAIGMGLDLAMTCDHRFVGPQGWLRQGWGRIGAVPGTGGELMLRLKAPGALWRILPGQPKVDADTAERLGLGESSGDVSALDAACRMAEALVEMPSAALRGYVELSRADIRSRIDDHLAAALQIQIGLLSDPDFADRARSTVAKKPSVQ